MPPEEDVRRILFSTRMVSAMFKHKVFAVLQCICFYVKKREKTEEVPCAVVFVIIRFPHWKVCKHYFLHQNKCKEPIVPAVCCLVTTKFLLKGSSTKKFSIA